MASEAPRTRFRDLISSVSPPVQHVRIDIPVDAVPGEMHVQHLLEVVLRSWADKAVVVRPEDLWLEAPGDDDAVILFFPPSCDEPYRTVRRCGEDRGCALCHSIELDIPILGP